MADVDITSLSVDFYPRPPRGGRRTHRGACDVLSNISIHALREEGDFPFSVLFLI